LYSKKGRDCICHCDYCHNFFGFPPPVGIETRPQSNVSLVWLAYFFVVLIIEITTIPSHIQRSSLGGVIGILTAILYILFVVADQARLLQPEVVTPLSYSILQSVIVIGSITFAYFSWAVY
jgi:hypothetical protein